MAIDVAPTATHPQISWASADQLAFRFNGSVAVDISEDEDRTLFDRLAPNVELEVRAVVIASGVSIRWTRDRTGEGVAVLAQKTLTVESIWPAD